MYKKDEWKLCPMTVSQITGRQSSSPKTGGQIMGCWKIAVIVVCQVRKGQSELMGSICCTWIPFILITISQSHHSSLSVLYSANPQVDPKTHTGISTVVLFLCHDSHNPLCLWIYVLCLDSFFVMIMSYHTFLLQLWQFCLLSAPLWFPCLHTLYLLFIFSYWSMCSPALNSWVYN